MVAFNKLLVAVTTLVAGVVAAPTFGPIERETELVEREATELVKRQQRFATQYWANDNANLTWKSGNAGLYSVDWKNPSGGNFVVGKGYSGQGM
jgi:FlaG/FlaF family flagellin (archaellin)